jgi:uncharacterized protein YbcV (DUF1398 family)
MLSGPQRIDKSRLHPKLWFAQMNGQQPIRSGTAHLAASWRAGVVRYGVDFEARTIAYYGCNGSEYVEAYPAVEVAAA